MLAVNAQPILDARLRGFKPDAMTIISVTGHVEAKNHVVRAIPGNVYDWRWVRGLEVCLYVGERNDWFDTLKAIALARPDYLGLWSCRDHCGARVFLVPTPDDIGRPVREWQFEIDLLPWMDFENDDFLVGRTYNRTPQGMPYAAHT